MNSRHTNCSGCITDGGVSECPKNAGGWGACAVLSGYSRSLSMQTMELSLCYSPRIHESDSQVDQKEARLQKTVSVRKRLDKPPSDAVGGRDVVDGHPTVIVHIQARKGLFHTAHIKDNW